MPTDSTSTPTRRSIRAGERLEERRLRRRPILVLSTLTTAFVIAASATAMAPAPQAAQAEMSTPAIALASFTRTLPESLTEGVATSAPESKIQSTIDKAEKAVAASTDVTADIKASKLNVGTKATTVPTDDLTAAVDELETVSAMPLLLDTRDATTAVEAEIATVNEKTSALRGRLDAAVEKEKERVAEEKRKAEAAAKAAAEKKAAEEAAAAEAEASSSRSSSSSSTSSSSSDSSPAPSSGGSSGGTSPSAAKATARAMLGDYGWGDDQYSCLVSLWNKESGWNYRASNPSSGAYGIPQALPGSKMGSVGSDWRTNPATQIAWGFGYIDGRYGSPCGAWSHSQNNGWY
ncbi:lytic transglycosylase domain-containing protein [Microbacterium oleivorans]|uniref:16S rRNA uridine-516 pseudouridylate synthase n=1 Tax=Microbacterium oleivorans TaxID=273677 RepID=A0A031FTY3_9MICO|nr:lytic transglycosylase domain-containing protein [Microbacterium oleivorans]EZP28063.1 16S rRNA uridine-516 pseudouridylate synthase precursor [Microbacterium oleivorans]THE06458.1 lytic transglycosylase domain-containing protein [Microbacterium oleivorans]